MNRFILTGTPGAGKTAIIRRLELDGFSVVEEAAKLGAAILKRPRVCTCPLAAKQSR
jgi:predicted ATPase